MKTLSKSNITKLFTFALLASTALPSFAGVKYRIAFENATQTYAVYMTPDSTPRPDLLISAQITLVAPHSMSNPFGMNTIQSAISGVNWMVHSRVNAPRENVNGDYISAGYVYTGFTPTNFNWIAGQEKKILSFSSPQGCVSGVKLMADTDPFNALPNSYNTNPGNDFTNLGWTMENAYMGNYGTAVTCQ